MQFHAVVLAGITGIVGVVAGRASRPAPGGPPVAAPTQAAPTQAATAPARADIAGPVVRGAVFAAPAPDRVDGAGETADEAGDGARETADEAGEAADEPDATPADDDTTAGEDVAAVLAAAEHRFAEQRRERNAVLGHLSDQRTWEPVVGATVIAMSPALGHTQTAISDAQGNYELVGLPAGSYLLMFYYGEVEIEHDGVSVSDYAAIRLSDTIDVSYRPPEAVEGVSFTGVTEMTNTYFVDDIQVFE